MKSFPKPVSFEWDKGNLYKSYKKHGVKPIESEEAFLDGQALIVEDNRHSGKEKRYQLLGKTSGQKVLFVVFTMRGRWIRVISARRANKKEIKQYE